MNRTLVAVATTAVLALTPLAANAAHAAPGGKDRSATSRSQERGDKRERGGKRDRAKMVNMQMPIIVAHRGASGYRPEHTLAAYELAVQMGADYIEPDLVLTKDGVLVARHEPEIGGTTDVADRAEFASRKRTKMLDGTEVTGWFTEDFTLAELKTLRAKERLPEVRQQNTIYDGLYQVPTYAEVLQLRADLSKKHGRTIGVIPEIKHSRYFHDQGLDPEKPFVHLSKKAGLNSSTAPLWLQSFEVGNLKYVRTLGYKANSTFLGWTGTGEFDGPYDRIADGDTRTYSEYFTPAGLDEIATFANGIGPQKEFVIPRKADGTLGEPTSLVKDAHARGLKVVPWTFRNENRFMATNLRTGEDQNAYGRAIEEMVIYMRTGIDGLFTDNPDTGVVARDIYRAEHGR